MDDFRCDRDIEWVCTFVARCKNINKFNVIWSSEEWPSRLSKEESSPGPPRDAPYSGVPTWGAQEKQGFWLASATDSEDTSSENHVRSGQPQPVCSQLALKDPLTGNIINFKAVRLGAISEIVLYSYSFTQFSNSSKASHHRRCSPILIY